jgi:adenylate cyclase
VVPTQAERRLAAILSADVVGYSRLMADDEDATIRAVTARREEVELHVRQHGGRLNDFTGDNFLAEFGSAVQALECAVEIQRVVAALNASLPLERKMEFRMGLHLGEVRVQDDRLFGTGVNVAARLEGLAEPGGICISAVIHDQLGNTPDLGYEDLGEHSVKNIPTPVRAYRVRVAGVGAERGPGEPPRAMPSRAGRAATARHRAVALGFVLLIGAVLTWWLHRPAPPPGPIRSIAVLPFANLSGDPEQEYFADGMTEALIADLARLDSLRVISRTSVMRYKRAHDESLPEIAEELGVDAVLEGSVMRAGARVRITTQLIDARTDDHLWAERYDRDLSETLILQADIARVVANQIRTELLPEQGAAAPSAVDPEAHQAYLKGRYLSSRGDTSTRRVRTRTP